MQPTLQYEESRIILTQKSFWYHFPFQRYEKNYTNMLEFQEFKNLCFRYLKVSFCKQVNDTIACKQAFPAMFSRYLDMDLEEYVPEIIWGHNQEYDKFDLAAHLLT